MSATLSAERRTDPALSRNRSYRLLGGGAFTKALKRGESLVQASRAPRAPRRLALARLRVMRKRSRWAPRRYSTKTARLICLPSRRVSGPARLRPYES
jgi:hypothetical protein